MHHIAVDKCIGLEFAENKLKLVMQYSSPKKMCVTNNIMGLCCLDSELGINLLACDFLI